VQVGPHAYLRLAIVLPSLFEFMERPERVRVERLAQQEGSVFRIELSSGEWGDGQATIHLDHVAGTVRIGVIASSALGYDLVDGVFVAVGTDSEP